MKISAWKEKMLFVRGKEMLLKFVVQAIPTFVMFVLKFLIFYKGIIDVMSHFWQGDEDNRKMMH